MLRVGSFSSGSRYQILHPAPGSALRQQVRSHEPARLVDTLLIGAIIEARSCERFAVLAPELDDDLGQFYRSLLRSEARHFSDYLKLAVDVGSQGEIQVRLPVLLEFERGLIEAPDASRRGDPRGFKNLGGLRGAESARIRGKNHLDPEEHYD